MKIIPINHVFYLRNFNQLPVLVREKAIHQVCNFYYGIPVEVALDALRSANPLIYYSVSVEVVKFHTKSFHQVLKILKSYYYVSK